MTLPTMPTMSTMMTDRLSMYMGATNASSDAMAKDPHQMEATICTAPIAMANGLRHRTAYTSTTAQSNRSMATAT